MVTAMQSDPTHNEDARSSSSTLVSGDAIRNDVDVPEQPPIEENTLQIRHGFDQESYEEDIIHFLYFSEKRHDTNSKPNVVARNTLKDWVKEKVYTLNSPCIIIPTCRD